MHIAWLKMYVPANIFSVMIDTYVYRNFFMSYHITTSIFCIIAHHYSNFFSLQALAADSRNRTSLTEQLKYVVCPYTS